MTIKDKIRISLKERILKTVVKGTPKSNPILVYEVPKPDNYDELVKRVKKNHPELNQDV